MRALLVFALVVPLIALACGGSPPQPEAEPQTPLEVAERFLSLWQQKRYSDMYDLISSEAQATIARDKFIDRYEAIAEEATITGIDYQLPSVVGQGATEVPFTVTIHTTFFGDIFQENVIPLTSEGEDPAQPQLRIQWSPSLILVELDDRSLVHFFPVAPRRGTIFDAKGRELAVDAKVPVIGVVPDLIEDREATIAALAQALQLPPEEVRAQVEADVPSYYFIPIRTLPFGTPLEALQPLYALADLGVVVREEARRIYPHGDAAAHVLGYLREINAEELEELAAKGYEAGDKIGAFGLEGSMEATLAGERGGVLATITPEGTIARTIAEKATKPGLDLHLTIDIDVQKTAEAALGQRVGSIVVMNPSDNSVLALASYPRFDPNSFIQGLSPAQFAELSNDPRQPFLHRPLLATYPAGSTFKVVTMAAGLERGGFSPGSTLPCPPVWYGLGPDFPKKNWQSYDRGYLTPAQGLMASCNPVFYEMALRLDHEDPNILPEFARAFGFGAPTGIQGLDEAPGVAPGPDWKEEALGEPWYSGDSVNMGIGQGFLLVTPLQLANAYSALADGAVLRRPLLIRKISTADGAAAQEFAAEKIRDLPISTSTLAAIREGLTLVTQNPGGTSYQVFAGSSVDAAGKSGTAEDLAVGSNHVFFVAYANRDNPSVLAIAALEEGESGSREAGPMVRLILEQYIGSLARAGP